MSRPWLPPRSNLTGTALPAVTRLTVGVLSIGWKKPWKLKTTLYEHDTELALPTASVAERVTDLGFPATDEVSAGADTFCEPGPEPPSVATAVTVAGDWRRTNTGAG